MQDLKDIDPPQHRNMRTILRHRGLYVSIGHKNRIAHALNNLLTEFIPRPVDETMKHSPQPEPVPDISTTTTPNLDTEGDESFGQQFTIETGR